MEYKTQATLTAVKPAYNGKLKKVSFTNGLRLLQGVDLCVFRTPDRRDCKDIHPLYPGSV